MKIRSIEAIPLSIPYTYGASAQVHGRNGIHNLDTCLLRVETDDGLAGWGDAFAYGSLKPVTIAVREMVAPLAIGHDAADIDGLHLKIQKALHIFGRYGITVHALSGLDIALWDLAGKRAGKPIAQLIGAPVRSTVPAYASLLRYADQALVARYATRAVEQQYAAVKLHEIDESVIAAARGVVPAAVPLMFDVNCPWTPAQAEEICARLAAHDPHWIEEPVFPPEDFSSLKRVRAAARVPVAAGENWCFEMQFRHALDAGAVDIAQPSVTKVGGITAFLKVMALARERGIRVAPHSPYFGPGAIATLHLLAHLPAPAWFEMFFLTAQASLYPETLVMHRGVLAIPQGPGLGVEPDAAVIARYRQDRS